MSEIREWVEREFGGPEPKIVIECGANVGQDTQWLAALPNTSVIAVEADPRNTKPLRERVGHLPNVRLHPIVAIADHDGIAELTLSETCRGKPWTESSSICRPTGHLTLMPFVTFYDRTVSVACMTLDTLAEEEGIGDVALIWSDIQGAEPQLIMGGQKTLARTRYLYAEVPPTEEYEGQLPLGRILERLPGWTVVQCWPSDVLLVNGNL